MIKTNSLKAWILAARPKTLSGAAVPVMIGIALAWHYNGNSIFLWTPAVLCMLFAFVMQIDANFINDYFDCIRGNDSSETRLGPKRACTEGWITLPAMRIGLGLTTVIACIIGLPLVIYGGLEMIWVGIACVLFCFLYTTKLSYMGLGDLLVLIFFGIVPVSCTVFVINSDAWTSNWYNVLTAGIACGLVIDTLLLVNNYRDIDNDKHDGKKTLVVRIGKNKTEKLYFAVGAIGAYLITVATNSLMSLIPLIVYFILHCMTLAEMKHIGKGKELNKVLGHTARNMFIFGIASTIAILIS